MMIEPGWQERAKCAGLGRRVLPKEEQTDEIKTEADRLFFVGQGGKSTKARAFCRGFGDREPCPVIKDCLHYAVLYDKDGMWGGTSKQERDKYSERLKLALLHEATETGRLEVHDVDAFLEAVQVQGEQAGEATISGNLTINVDDYIDATIGWLRNINFGGLLTI